MNYKFNIEIAKQYGVNEAIFIQNLWWWIERNRQSEINYYTVELRSKHGESEIISDYWTYNSMRAFEEVFPFWSKRQIRTIIENCKKKELIVTSNLNQRKYDRTMWYALTDKVKKLCKNSQEHLTETSQGIDESVTPIPDNKPVIKPNNNQSNINISKINNSRSFHEEKKKQVKNQVFHEKSEPYMLARFLEEQIQKHTPEFKTDEARRQRWARDIDLMIRRDSLDPDKIADVIVWSHKNTFWRANILSGKKLREKYLQLSIQMNCNS